MIIIGSHGQLARAFKQLLGKQGYFTSREELNLLGVSDIKSRLDCIVRNQPPTARKIIIVPAAFTDVDRAEAARNDALAINALAPEMIAQWAHDHDYFIVHYSTDFVYDGSGCDERSENEAGGPINYYGVTKLLGEEKVRSACPNHLIFRTSWLYGDGKNFPQTIINLAKTKGELHVVADQIGAPTYAIDLAKYSLKAISRTYSDQQPDLCGTYNLAASGLTSRLELAKYVVEEAVNVGILHRTPIITGVPSELINSPAKRPKNSRMSLSKFTKSFDLVPAPWQLAIKDWLAHLLAERKS